MRRRWRVTFVSFERGETCAIDVDAPRACLARRFAAIVLRGQILAGTRPRAEWQIDRTEPL